MRTMVTQALKGIELGGHLVSVIVHVSRQK